MKPFDFLKKHTKSHYKGFPVTHVLGASALGLTLLAFSVHSPSDTELPAFNERWVEKPLQLGFQTTTTSNAITPPALQELSKHIETVKTGDSLSVIFNRAGLSDTTLYAFMRSHKKARLLTKLYPGQTFTFELDKSKRLERLHYRKDRLTTLSFIRDNDRYTFEETVVKPDVHLAYREAVIKDSLFLAGTRARMEQSLIMELASIFGWDVDFALDIRENDSFKVLYEEHFISGEKIKNGAILAAEFSNQGKVFRAVRYTDENGISNYFTPEGKSMRKAFLRTPIDFARISSHFNLKRKHPILNRIRAHKGTDYAAARGTPIKAAGDGKVIFAGRKSGYGNTVIIKHGQSYKTLYAHMHKFGRGVRSGKRVKQGQIIGTVGSTGLATGPHLHYEFHLNGVVRNPVRVPLPQAKSIAKASLDAFYLQTKPLVAQLEAFTREYNNTQLAAH